MTLPFENTPRGKRVFVCFCCGSKQLDWVSFKEHVRNTHEEGREYVVCPLARCCAPVRDIRAHFKSCHPQEPIPKTGQMKALIWKDSKDMSKRQKKVSFKEGWHISPKTRKKMSYRSGWELDTYRILDRMDEVIGYEVEPLKIEYFFDGERRTYLPDLLVYFADGNKEIWEIKPQNQCDAAINVAKWSYCVDYCQNRGIEFKVITEVGIAKMKKAVKLND